MNKKHEMTRREFLSGSMAMAALGIWSLHPSIQETTVDLRGSAAKKGILFGSAFSTEYLKDPAYSALVLEQCGILTPEVELKWAALRPTPQGFDFSRGDALCQLASQNHISFRGHTLVWEIALPAWAQYSLRPTNAEQIMTDHITQVTRHYRGKVSSWDVVNEAVQVQDGRSDGLKITPWLRNIGPEYIEIAYRAAHEADPNAQLIYNENWIEPDDSDSEKRRRAVLALLTDLKKKSVPIHGLGIQSHIFAEARVTGTNYQRFLREVEDLGLAILITEMDVRDHNLPGDVAVRDRQVADQYERYLSFMLERPSVKTVMTWGISNRYTWISTHNRRSDGLPVRVLPFSSDLMPTPAAVAIERALDQASHR